MRCQTSDALGVDSDPGGGWRRLKTIDLIPTRSLPRATRDNPEPWLWWFPFFPSRAVHLALLWIFPCLSHLPRLRPLPRTLLLLPSPSPSHRRAEPVLSPLAAPRVGTHPQRGHPLATWDGGKVMFTPLQPLLFPGCCPRPFSST